MNAGRAPAFKKWHHLIVASLAAFMSTLDASIVNVALPTIAAEFGVGVKAAAWAVQSYLLATMALLLLGGRLLDRWGARGVMAAGFALYTAGSALCALAVSLPMLVSARAFQGIGAALLVGSNQGLVARAFPPGQRGRTLGLLGTVVSIGLATGPPLGGLLIGLLGWRSIFYINLPVGAAAIIHAARVLPSAAAPDRGQKFDWAGTALIAAGLSALFAGVDLGADAGWTRPAPLGLIAGSLAILALFLRHEAKTKFPLLTLALFESRYFTQSCAAAFLVFFAMISATVLMPFFMQAGLGYAPQQVGLVMMALPGAMLLLAPLGGWLSDVIGTRIPASIGLGLVAAGLLALSGLTADSSAAHILAGLTITGAGMGFFGSPNSNAILSSAPADAVGLASGLSALMRTAGIGFGTAFAATAFTFFKAREEIARAVAGRAAPPDAALYVGGIPPVFTVAALVVAANIANSALRGRGPSKG